VGFSSCAAVLKIVIAGITENAQAEEGNFIIISVRKMTGSTVVLDDRQMSLWDAFVEHHDAGTVYHTSAWRRVIEKVYGHQPLYFALMGDDGNIVAGLPAFLIKSRLTGTRLSTLPCAQSCNPLIGTVSHYEDLKRGILDFMANREIKSWEMKTTNSFILEKSGNTKIHDGYVTHILQLDRPAADLLHSFHKSSIQRAIKKASRYGLVLKRCDSLHGVEHFFRLYVHMRRSNGLLPQPRHFFEVLWDIMRGEKMIDILYAEYQGRVIATIMLLKYKDAVIYEYGAMADGAQQYSPSPFLLWEAIRDSAAEGYKTFDLGRTAATEKSLALFKSRWGTQEEALNYYEFGNNADVTVMRQSDKIKKMMGIFTRIMPNPACNLAGRILYRHLV
jgi:Acetyltransferase (GNAT) domain